MEPKTNIIGGAGTYAAMGARLVTPSSQGKSIGWVVDAGSDFPEEMRKTIDRWGTGCVWREDKSRLTTRSWNGYGDNDQRGVSNLSALISVSSLPFVFRCSCLIGIYNVAFKYTTPKIRLDHNSLPRSHILSKSFHLICSPKRCMELVKNILAERSNFSNTEEPLKRPLFVWEPVPDLCVPGEKLLFHEAARCVDVVSPNELELAGYYGEDTCLGPNMQIMAAEVLDQGIGQDGKGALVVRCGKSGSVAFTRSPDAQRDAEMIVLPAFYGPHKDLPINSLTKYPEPIIDPTGAGNTFCGALAVSMVRYGEEAAKQGKAGGDVLLSGLIKGLISGTVAAAFAIEQLGMPTQSLSNTDGECWNGTRVQDRMKEYIQDLKGRTAREHIQSIFTLLDLRGMYSEEQNGNLWYLETIE